MHARCPSCHFGAPVCGSVVALAVPKMAFVLAFSMARELRFQYSKCHLDDSVYGSSGVPPRYSINVKFVVGTGRAGVLAHVVIGR